MTTGCIPARAATGQIEWPTTDEPNPTPIAQPPLGITHHYCRLALIDVAGNPDNIIKDDCRAIFPSLTQTAIHVTEINWPNDQSFPRFFIDGLKIELDAKPLLWTINSSSLIVTIELPTEDDSDIRPDVFFILHGEFSVDSKSISWKPNSNEINNLRDLFDEKSDELRVRVTLKGRFIWSDFGKKRLYLDGQVFGKPGFNADGTLYTDLELPSGVAGTKASDFESWFYVQLNQLIVDEPDNLQVESVRFITSESRGEERVLATLSSQEEFQSGATIDASAVVSDADITDSIEITFNYPITNLVEAPTNIRVLGVPPNSQTGRQQILDGRLDLDRDNLTLRYTLTNPKIFPSGSNTLTIFGDDYNSANALALKAENNTMRLDGNFNGNEGGNFELDFNVTRSPRERT